jgi:ABC-type antimicrobial peptide transport system permease subunit
MKGVVQDFRDAPRQVPKSPGYRAIVILALALGIGVHAGIFRVIETVVLRPLPFRDPDRLVWLNGKIVQTDQAGVSRAAFPKSTDPLSVVGVVRPLGIVPAVAGLIPEGRAARLNPMVALRYE